MAGDSIAVICGPTGAGKSALSLALAREFGGTIIAADSRQVYRQFDIGTAKPNAREREIPHRGIDVVDPEERYSAARWAADAATWIVDVEGSGGVAIVVGGTGFYIRSLFEPLFEGPVLHPLRREALGDWLDAVPTPELRRWCGSLDPGRAHLGRTQLSRAIETALLTGARQSDLQRQSPGRAHVARPARYLYVDPGAELPKMIEARTDAMLAGGWIDEVQRLMNTVPTAAPAWKASGYSAIREVVLGRSDLSSARRRVIIETRQYAKRQRTWFRHQLPPESVLMMNPLSGDAFDRAANWLSGR